jgi:hypothetical protein
MGVGQENKTLHVPHSMHAVLKFRAAVSMGLEIGRNFTWASRATARLKRYIENPDFHTQSAAIEIESFHLAGTPLRSFLINSNLV